MAASIEGFFDRRSHRSYASQKLTDRTRQIVDQINSENIFQQGIKLNYEIGENLVLRLFQGTQEIALGSFSIQATGEDANTAHIGWVGSIKEKAGKRLGSFLFLVMIKILNDMDVKSITLDNYTDNPGRASQNIYKFMEWDVSKLNAKELRNFDKLTIDEKALYVEGEMKAVFDSESRKKLLDLVKHLVEKININISANSDIWKNISKLSQIFRECGQGGGKTQPCRKTRRKYRKNTRCCGKRKKNKKSKKRKLKIRKSQESRK